MKKITRSFIFLFLIFSVLANANENISFRLEADQRIIEFENQRENLSLEAFASLALIASGTSEENIPLLEKRLFDLSNQLQVDLPTGLSQAQKAEYTLTFLYERVLSRYSEQQTRVDIALQNGTYNCVSSAVLYHFLAKSIDLEVVGVQTPDHAFCMVKIDEAFIDVETTNPYGYDPGKKKPLEAADSQRERYVILPQTIYRNRAAISERSLIALMYQNRITSLAKKAQYEVTLPLAIDAWTLVGKPHKDSVLFSHLRNYAVFLMQQGQHQNALSFLDTVRISFAGDTEFSDIRQAAIAKMINRYLDASDFDAAFILLAQRESDFPSTDYSKMFGMVLFNSIYAQIQKKSFSDSRALIEDNRMRLLNGDFERLIVQLYSKEADRIARLNEWMKAVAVLDEALTILPKNSDLLKQRSVYRQNRASDIHNSAATAWNNGDTQNARKIIEMGLAEIPESTLLKNDLKIFSR